MSIRRQIFAAFTGIVVIVIAFILATTLVFRSFQELADDVVNSDVPAFVALGQVETLSVGLIESMRGAATPDLDERAEEIEEYETRRDQLLLLIADLETSFAGDAHQHAAQHFEGIHELEEATVGLTSATDAYIARLLQPDANRETLAPFNEVVEDFEDELDVILTAQIEEIEADVAWELNEMNDSVAWLIGLSTVGGIALFGGAIVLGMWFTRRLVQPIEELESAMASFGHGAAFKPLSTTRDDEFGSLAASFNKLVDDLQSTTVSRDYVDNIIQAMGSAMVVTDADGTILNTNATLEQLLGYSADELKGISIQRLLPAEDITEKPVSVRASIYRKDGETVTVALTRRMVGADNLVVYNAQDLTVLAQTQLELGQAQSVIATQERRVKRLYTMIDLMLKQLNSVFQYGASREELRTYMDTLNTEFDNLREVLGNGATDPTPESGD